MDYRRVYWLLFLGAASLFGVLRYLDYVARGSLTTRTAITIAVAVVIALTSAFAVTAPEKAGGPTEPNARLALAVVAFLLMLWLVGEQLLAA